MKKKGLAVLTVIALVITMIPTNFASAAPGDIAGHWAFGSIDKMIRQNIMKGYEDNTFKPDKLSTREEVCAVLNAYIKGDNSKKSIFEDVKGRWSEGAVANLTDMKILSGYPDGTFKPTKNISRDEFANILYRYMRTKFNFSGVSEKNFTDVGNSYAKEAISKLAGAGIIKGYSDGTFGMGKGLSRAELATLMDMAGTVETNKSIPPITGNNPADDKTKPNVSPGGSGSGGGSGGGSSGGSTLKNPKHDRIVLEGLPAADIAVSDIKLSTEYTTAEVSGKGKWETTDTHFQPLKEYVAVIKLTPKEGYTLNNLSSDFFKVGNAKVGSVSFNAATSELRAKFVAGNTIKGKGFSADITNNGNLLLNRYEGNDKAVTVPKEINGREVVGFGWGTFQDRNDVESISFEAGIKLETIGQHCFANCKGLKGKITVPEGVKKIEEKAFNGCKKLEQIDLPASVNELEWDIVRGCENLKKITFATKNPPAKLTKNQTFSEISSKTVIEIPENGDVAAYRTAFKDAGLPDGVQIVRKGEAVTPQEMVFRTEADGSLTLIAYNKEDENVVIPAMHDGKQVRKIGDKVFFKNKKIKTLVLEEGIEIIGMEAFYSCDKLESVTLPASVKNVRERAFASTGKLNKVELLGNEIPVFGNNSMNISKMPSNKTARIIIPDTADLFEYGKVLQNAKAAEIIEIARKSDSPSSFRWIFNPDGYMVLHRCMDENVKEVNVPAEYAGKPVKEIGANCFIFTRKLEKVTLPDSLTKIGRAAFESRKNLKQIDIPKNVTKIGYAAFKNCSFYDEANDIGIVIKFNSETIPEFVDATKVLSPDWTEVDEEPNAFEGIHAKSEITVFSVPLLTPDKLAEFKKALQEKGGLSDKIEVKTGN